MKYNDPMMDSKCIGFREVTPDQFYPEKWKEFTINIGGTQALQEIKVPERAGGYSYQNQTKLYTRNRFLYWRISHDVLELVEHSLDVNLVGNALRYRFQDMPVLEGVSIHETDTSVIVLVATVSSIHRLAFPHPDFIYPEASTDFTVVHHPDIGVKSIFADAKLSEARDTSSFYVINNMATNATLPHISASLVTAEGDSLFALAYANGGILLLNMNSERGEVTVKEVKQDSYVPRFLSGITSALRRGRGLSSQEAVSLALLNIGTENYLFTLYRDGCLAMWSCGRVTCICSLDIPHCTGGEPGRYATEGVQSHMLRKAHDSKPGRLILAVYLCFANNSEIVLVEPVQLPGGSFKLDLLITVQTPVNDLVEMTMSLQYLWCVWRGAHGDTHVSRMVVSAENIGWQMAYLEPPPDIEEKLHAEESIADQYLSYIFDSGRFSMAVISRALSLFRRSNLRPETTLSYKKLRDRVLQTVYEETAGMIEDLTKDDEFIEIQSQCWLRFYSDCVQYNEASSRPVGLALMGDSGVVLIKRQQYSLLRPMENVERIFLCNTIDIPKDDTFSPEVVALMNVLVLLENNTSSVMKAQFELELEELNSPDSIMKQLLNGEDIVKPSVLHHIGQNLLMVGDVCRALVDLIQILTIAENPEDEEIMQNSISELSKLNPLIACLFGSTSGSSVTVQSLKQMIAVRVSICRNLLVLQYLLMEYMDHLGIRDEMIQFDYMRTSLIPRTVILTQAYYSITWLSNTVVSLPLVNKPESNEAHLALLGLVKVSHLRPLSIWSHDWRPQTVLELLIQTIRAAPARALLSVQKLTEAELAWWPLAMVQFILSLSKFVWPMINYSAISQLLLTMSQYRLVQEYVRLLRGWCVWNSCVHLFMLGAALLYSNEPHKALIILQKVAKKDAARVLLNHFQGGKTQSQEESILIRYYFLLIEMFSQLQHWDCVLKLAHSALVHASNEIELAKLHVVAFKIHLQQGNHIDAFSSLTAITDKECSRLCLHQLVITMFDRSLLEPLMEFPEPSMFKDLQEVVLSRARAADLQQSYYNFLYAFHMRRGNVRKAADAMVEQGLRLGNEPNPTLKVIKRQADCYLAGMNALRLASPNYAWIVKPKMPASDVNENESVSDDLNGSSKQRVEGAEIFAMEGREQVELMEVTDIEREYDLVSARLALIKLNPDYFTNIVSHLSPTEVVTACTNAGLYEIALSIGKQFSLRFEPILAHLAHACVDMTKQGLKNSEETWAWLKENDVWEFDIGDANALNLSWKLLEVLLTRYEEPRQSSLHKAVTRVLLQAGFFLPHWLLASYRRINSSELLREYLAAGRLEEAAYFAQKMMWATLGRSKEEFGLATALATESPYVYVPLHTIDRLIIELQAAAESSPELYAELLEKVRKMQQRYKEEALQVSQHIMFRKKGISNRA